MVYARTRAHARLVVRQRCDVRAGNRTTSLSKSGVTCVLTPFVVYARTRGCAHARYRYKGENLPTSQAIDARPSKGSPGERSVRPGPRSQQYSEVGFGMMAGVT